MVNADIIMFRELPDGSFVAEDKYATAQAPPVLDTSLGGASSLSAWGALRSGGVLYARFTRPATTGDRFDLPLVNAAAQVLLAYNAASNADTSVHTARAIVVLTAGSTVAPSPPAAVVAHAFLMLTAFPVLMALGSFTARFVPKGQTWWFPAHWIMELVGALLAAVAFIVIVVHVGSRGGAHFSVQSVTGGAHQIIGLIVVLATLAQLSTGLISHCTWQGAGSATRVWPVRIVVLRIVFCFSLSLVVLSRRSPLSFSLVVLFLAQSSPPHMQDYVHHWGGRVMLLLACVNVFLGIWAIGYEPYVFVVYALLLAAIGVLFIVLQCRMTRAAKTGTPDAASYVSMQAL